MHIIVGECAGWGLAAEDVGVAFDDGEGVAGAKERSGGDVREGSAEGECGVHDALCEGDGAL